jgi:hypothetical protein
MERRGFLKLLVGGVAAAAAVQTWPFRVYSFPSEVTLVEDSVVLAQLNEMTYKYIIPALGDNLFTPSPLFERLAREEK